MWYYLTRFRKTHSTAARFCLTALHHLAAPESPHIIRLFPSPVASHRLLSFKRFAINNSIHLQTPKHKKSPASPFESHYTFIKSIPIFN